MSIAVNIFSVMGINDVLDHLRLEDGSLELERRAFNLWAVFRKQMKLVKPVAFVKKVFVALNIDPNVPEFSIGDEKRLMQMALNIVGNAVKFAKEGIVTISVRLERLECLQDPRHPDFQPAHGDEHCYLRVQVCDTGLGLNAKDIPKLLNKVVLIDSTIIRNCGGAGPGLAICKRLVELMEGNIWIESERLGKGSTVIFIVKLGLPLQVSHAD